MKKRGTRAGVLLTPKSRAVPALLASVILASSSFGQQASLPNDPSAPLRRFPISITIRRPGAGKDEVSLLHLPNLQPKDDLLVRSDPEQVREWTFVEAIISSGQRIQVRHWNLWEKRWQKKPVDVGALPQGDVIPLFFLVLNKRKDGRVADAVRHALETSTEQIVSQTAIFQSTYQQQNRLLNFMTAYASLGPKAVTDPIILRDRIQLIDADLGLPYTATTTQPGQLQTGLDAGVGALSALRQEPDNPLPAATVVQGQLPAVVADWVGLVSDMVHIFIKPRSGVKLTFIPASMAAPESVDLSEDSWLQLVTERVPETKDGSLPALVVRPTFESIPLIHPIPLNVARSDVLASDRDVAIPIAPECRDLFTHPWAWRWEISDDGQFFTRLPDARLIPGRGVVFPISSSWWNGASERKIHLRARIGFQLCNPVAIHVAKALPQQWATDAQNSPDVAVSDPSVAIRLNRTGPAQPFYQFVVVSLTDAGGKTISADSASYDGSLLARFNLTGLTPGVATIKVQQEGAAQADEPAQVFLAPKRPEISIYCGKGDRVLRISGPDARWVKSVQVPSLNVQEVDDSEPGNRRMTLSAAFPQEDHQVAVTYRDPSRGLEWTRVEQVSLGQPRPRITATLVGTIPSTISDGSGADPSWALATLPPGWIRSNQPIRVQLTAVQPFAWTHDVVLDVGLGSAGDVQPVCTAPEGPLFAMDGLSPNAFLTLTLDSALPQNPKRNSGLIWLRLTRSDLSSPWTIASLDNSSNGLPIRAVRLPVVQAFDTTPTGIHLVLANADQVLGIRFGGQSAFVSPQLDGASPNLLASVDGPAGATEFDIQLRDATDGVIHVKISKPQPK